MITFLYISIRILKFFFVVFQHHAKNSELSVSFDQWSSREKVKEKEKENYSNSLIFISISLYTLSFEAFYICSTLLLKLC